MNTALICTLNKLAAKHKRLAACNNLSVACSKHSLRYAQYTNASKFGLKELSFELLTELKWELGQTALRYTEAMEAVQTYADK